MRDIKKDAYRAFEYLGHYESLSLIQQIKIVWWYMFNKNRLVEVFDNFQMGKSINDSFKKK